jgi:hypothetical protein
MNDAGMPIARDAADADRLLDEHESVLLAGVLVTRVSRLEKVTGDDVPGHVADQIGALLREHAE